MMRPDDHIPPQWPLRFFRWFCRTDVAEDIEGDLLERFELRARRHGVKKARRLLVKDVLQLFRPGMIKSFKTTQKLNTYDMFKHNLTLSFRNFRRHPLNFAINLTGLTAGLVCTLFIYLWVNDELSIDRYHENKDRLFQVMSNHETNDGIMTWKGVPGLLLEEIQVQVPEAEYAVATTDPHEYSLKYGQTSFKAIGRFASQDYLKAFSFPLASGNPEEALTDPSGIVISKSLAQKLFGNDNAVGKTLEWFFWERKEKFKVSAVMEDVPDNSSEHFEFLLNWDFYHDELINFKSWGNYYGRVMVVLHDAEQQATAAEKIHAIFAENNNADNDQVKLFLTSYDDRYLYDKYENGVITGGKIENVKLFALVGLFILLIACINFVNLSTAKAGLRAKETGVKKSLGASRLSLIAQFITESVVLSTISMFLALGIVYLLLPSFNMLAQKSLLLNLMSLLGIVLIPFMILLGLAAGLYPALHLSGFDAVRSLKGRLPERAGNLLGRKALVVVQFAISTVLITAVVIVYQQMEYIKNTHLGYDRDNLVYFEREGNLLKEDQAFIDALKNIPGVENASRSGFMIGGANATGGVDWEGKPEGMNVRFWELRADVGMLEMMGIELAEGRHFSHDFATESAAVIVNETAVKIMGFEDPVGKTIQHYSGDKRIVGVVKDFNLVSLHSPVEPTIFRFEPERTVFIMAKLGKGGEAETLRKIDELYASFNPDYTFKPIFMDQDYMAQYAAEERLGTLSRYFALFAIIISCLGLFGLASFMTERRTKEIGIRKVLGSRVSGIVYLLTIDFSKTVLLAILIGTPISYYLTQNWLESFAYKIDLNILYFAGGGFLAIGLAWLTVGLQTLKAARANPAISLRNE